MADAEDFLAEISSIVNTFEGSCPSCEATVTMRMMQVDMPEFNNKLMCQIKCAACGFARADTVPASTAEHLGPYFCLQLSPASNWKDRALVKSNSTEYSIPEIGLESARAGAGANLTVVELIENTKRELINAPAFQSVSQGEGMAKLMELISQMDEIIEGTMDATLIVQDSKQSMCYIEPRPPTEGEVDPFLSVRPQEA